MAFKEHDHPFSLYKCMALYDIRTKMYHRYTLTEWKEIQNDEKVFEIKPRLYLAGEQHRYMLERNGRCAGREMLDIRQWNCNSRLQPVNAEHFFCDATNWPMRTPAEVLRHVACNACVRELYNETHELSEHAKLWCGAMVYMVMLRELTKSTLNKRDLSSCLSHGQRMACAMSGANANSFRTMDNSTLIKSANKVAHKLVEAKKEKRNAIFLRPGHTFRSRWRLERMVTESCAVLVRNSSVAIQLLKVIVNNPTRTERAMFFANCEAATKRYHEMSESDRMAIQPVIEQTINESVGIIAAQDCTEVQTRARDVMVHAKTRLSAIRNIAATVRSADSELRTKVNHFSGSGRRSNVLQNAMWSQLAVVYRKVDVQLGVIRQEVQNVLNTMRYVREASDEPVERLENLAVILDVDLPAAEIAAETFLDRTVVDFSDSFNSLFSEECDDGSDVQNETYARGTVNDISGAAPPSDDACSAATDDSDASFVININRPATMRK